MPSTCSSIAATSLAVKSRVLAEELAGPMPAWPGRIIRTLLPSLATSEVTCAVVPWPRVTMTMTAPTPMTMPSTVSIERSAFLRMVWKESFSVSTSMGQPASAAGPSNSISPSTKRMMRLE